MDNLKNIDSKFNQVEYAKFIYENGIVFQKNKGYFNDIRILALYLRDYIGMKPKQREKFLYEFVSKYNPNFNVVQEYKIIDKALNISKNKKNKLRDIKSIIIFQEEIDHIQGLKLNNDLQKLLFTYLCCYKLSYQEIKQKYQEEKQNYKINKYILSIKDSKKKSNITFTKKKDISDLVRELLDRELIQINYDNEIYANFISDIVIKNPNNFIELTDFDNFGWHYEFLIGDKSIKICKKCGQIFKDKTVGKKQRPRILCNICQSYQKLGTKTIVCADCGEDVVVKSKDNSTQRCEECQKAHSREKNRQNVQAFRNKNH